MELWWKDTTAKVSIVVDVWETAFTGPSRGRRTKHGTLKLSAGTAGTYTVTSQHIASGKYVGWKVFISSIRVGGNFSCAAFCVSGVSPFRSGSPPRLPALDIEIEISSSTDIMVERLGLL